MNKIQRVCKTYLVILFHDPMLLHLLVLGLMGVSHCKIMEPILNELADKYGHCLILLVFKKMK